MYYGYKEFSWKIIQKSLFIFIYIQKNVKIQNDNIIFETTFSIVMQFYILEHDLILRSNLNF